MSDYLRITCAVPDISVAGVDYNVKQILKAVYKNKDSHIILFPELSVCGYTVGDLVLDFAFRKAVLKGLNTILRETKTIDSLIVVGAPLDISGQLYNTAVIMKNGKVHGIVPKTYIAEYNEHFEKRWYLSADNLKNDICNIPELSDEPISVGNNIVFDMNGFAKIGVEICEDLWSPVPQSTILALGGAEVVLNLSASAASVRKQKHIEEMVKHQSDKIMSAYALASAGSGESTTDSVYSGLSVIAQNGKILEKGIDTIGSSYCITQDIDLNIIRADRMKIKTFSDCSSYNIIYHSVNPIVVPCKWRSSGGSLYHIEKSPFIPCDKKECDNVCAEAFDIQVAGLVKRILAANPKALVIGVSGGLDSTLALLVSFAALKKLNRPVSDLVGVTMPAFGTTDHTFNNSLKLMKTLGITQKTISVKQACLQHMKDIEHDWSKHDTTYENVQARERTQVLMDYANKLSGFVVGTGDLSEMVLGWCTYNADHMSMYDVNIGIPKTLIKPMLEYLSNTDMFGECKDVLLSVASTPISPELLPPDDSGKISQKTEDLVGPYELHDFYLYYVLKYGFSPSVIYEMAKKAFFKDYSKEEILKWLKNFYKRFITQQFKRSCLPDGPKVFDISISPRTGLKMPSDASFELWISETEKLK